VNSDGMIIGLAVPCSESARSRSALSGTNVGGTSNLNLDGMCGQDDSRPRSDGIPANMKCGEDNAAGK
jgi:hypothetical protein